MADNAKTKRLFLVSAAVVASLMLAGCIAQEEPDRFNACLDTASLQFSAISMGSGAAPSCGPSEAAVSWVAALSGTGEQRELTVPTEPVDSVAGATGETGLTGDAGADGTTGATGTNGAAGANGTTGTTGTTGAAGTTGTTGTTGTAGATGEKGETGADGLTGSTGATGTNGVAGTTDATGLPGKDGTFILNGSGQPSNDVGIDGDFYLNITNFVVYGPKSSGAWSGTTQRLIGPQGAIGPMGPQGDTGSTGTAGLDGEAGAVGSTGLQGAQGPQGAQGLTGDTGATGPAGKDGAVGPAGGASVVDPNPNDLTYRMRIGTNPAVQITGFTQKITQSASALAPAGSTGKPAFGDIIATLPMNSQILAQLYALAKGTRTPTATVEMCQPGQITGRCALELSLTDVMVVGIDVRQDPTQATATVQLNFAQEMVSMLPGTSQAVTYEWDIAGNAMVAESGSARAASTGDTTYTTTLPGGSVISTRSWSQSSTQSGTTHLGDGAGKAAFADIIAETSTGPGTVALFRGVATGEVLPTVQLAGCEASTCATKTALTSVIVTSLVLGSPTLFDQVQFNYGAITWERNDNPPSPGQKKVFSWDVAENIAQ